MDRLLEELERRIVETKADLAALELVANMARRMERKDGEFAGGHASINHSLGRYVDGDVHTNTVEGYFALVKRGLMGIWHNVSKKHLHRYLASCEFRYNNRGLEDGQRTVLAIRQAEGKRLRYKEPVG